MVTRYSHADAGGDLVRDRAEARRPLLGRDLLGTLSPEQHHRITHRNLVTHRRLVAHPQVNHQLVHRDGAGDREAVTSDEHLSAREPEVARHAVGVADRDGRDAPGAAQLVAQPVRQP